MIGIGRAQSFVFLFLGESGARGQSDNSDLAPQYLEPDPTIQMVNNATLAVEPLQIGINNNLLHDPQNQWHGWEHGLQIHLKNVTGSESCFLCKVGVGGSTVGQWDVGDRNWSDYYLGRVGAMKDRTELVNTTWLMFFSLGLNDANQQKDPVAWRPQVEDLLARARAEVPQDRLLIMCPRFSSAMSANSSPQNFNAQLDSIAANDPDFYMIDTEGLQVKSDALHWATSANVEITRRFLTKYQEVR